VCYSYSYSCATATATDTSVLLLQLQLLVCYSYSYSCATATATRVLQLQLLVCYCYSYSCATAAADHVLLHTLRPRVPSQGVSHQTTHTALCGEGIGGVMMGRLLVRFHFRMSRVFEARNLPEEVQIVRRPSKTYPDCPIALCAYWSTMRFLQTNIRVRHPNSPR
jgi:hypothetical protein